MAGDGLSKKNDVNRAIGLFAEGRFDDAAVIFERVAKAYPNDALAHFNLGCARQEAGRLSAAAGSYRQATRLDPNLAKAWNNLGQTLVETGALDRAAACYRRAVAIDPSHLSARRSLTSATPPRWAQGLRLWQGEALGEGGLILFSNRGLGDAIEWLRYLPWARARAKRLQVVCAEPLVALLRQTGIEATATPRVARKDRVAPLSALRFLLFADGVPPAVAFPYLQVSPEAYRSWQDDLAAERALKVGLVWAGNPYHPRDRQRSLNYSTLGPLFDIPNVRFFSLQVGAQADAATAPRCQPLTDRLTDLAQTAGALSALDLLISVDTSVAHLAGALGRPVWLLLDRSLDRRWLAGDRRPPLYPSVRIFRQSVEGDWSGPINAVAKALSE